jgi:hypothetical protein
MAVLNKDEYIGKYMQWSDLVKLFPDKWVAVGDCKLDGTNISAGVVKDIVEDEDVDDKLIGYTNNHWICDRTTSQMLGGPVSVRIIKNYNG